MLTTTTRLVRQLKVQAASGAHARRGALLIEDALRTASLPFADQGRVVVIRRLALGRIYPLASAATVALRLECVVRQLETGAVRFDDPCAAQAPAVIFASTTEAIVQFARRLARHHPATEWFWRSALPGLNPSLGHAETWLWLIEQAHAQPATQAAIVAEAATADALDEVLAAIPVGRGRFWLRLAAWSAGGAPAPVHAVRFAHREESWLARQTAALSPDDDRILWMGTMLALSRHPSLAADPELPARVQSTLAAAALHLQAPDTASPAVGHEKPEAAASAGLRGRQPARHMAAARATGPGVSFRESPDLADQSDQSDRPDRSDRSDRSDKQCPPHPGIRPLDSAFGQPPELATVSGFAGLCFLVPALQRLGIEARLARDPWILDSGFPARLLLHLGQRIGLPDTDPLTCALQATCADTPPVDLPFQPWFAAVRHWCRRRTGLHLWEIVRRPGIVRLAPPHIEISFAPAQADLRLRRAGLDLDPGWVPWLGLVISYHYCDAH